MNMAWKEMKKNKSRFLIFGSIVLLVSLLTFIISGLANGLSQDNAALIKNLPEGQFYLTKEANESFALSRIDNNTQDAVLSSQKNAAAFSIQMGFLKDSMENQQSVAFVTSTGSKLFPQMKKGEVFLDSSMKSEGVKIGTTFTNPQLNGELTVKGFVEQSTFSHAPVAYLNLEDYREMYRVEDMQILFIPGKDTIVETTTKLQSFSKSQFLNTIASYKAEQMSLNMIVWFLIAISGLLFAIFFYMMNVQKIGIYGILKAIGVKTSTLFNMMWTQMGTIVVIAVGVAFMLSQVFIKVAPEGIPFHLPAGTTIQLSLVFMVIGFIGATLSGLQIKNIEPLQAIQQGEV
ncbi:ABC transporter permease [Bacillus rubiinfantis]|uniref:ABC transporter permease n=1 Tax=Bacillus rubiinfantis TaxID=1499680 RepID=UPI0005A657A6|nr:ABC transporter permease [Bacillus rubiinfantis]